MSDLHKAEAAAREADRNMREGGPGSTLEAALECVVTQRDLLAALDAARGEAVAWALPKALAETRADGFTVVRAGHQHHADGSYCVPLYAAPPAALAVPVTACPHSTRCHCIGVCKYGMAGAGARNDALWPGLAALVEEVDASFDTAEGRAYVEFYPVGPVDKLIAACRELINAQQPAAAVPAGWQEQLADSLECFWNAALGAERNGCLPTGAVAVGIQAVADRLREHAMLAAANKENNNG